MDTVGDNRVRLAIRHALGEAVRRLQSADARTEALAEFIPPHRTLIFPRRARMRPLGRIWRLGVFLLAADGTLYATGTTIRAVPPPIRSNSQSLLADQRLEYRAAAVRAKFPEGETVNFGAPAIDLQADLSSAGGPLFVRDGTPLVRWSATAGDAAATPFADYVRERVELLAHPPAGS